MPRPNLARVDALGAGADATSLTLLERAKTRDGDAWRRLHALYSPLLRHWCRRWGVRPEDVDDVTQDVFQAVASSLDSFRRESEDDSFRGWLHGVARYKVLTLRRREGARGAAGADFHEHVLLLTAPSHDPSDEEERGLVDDLYREAMEAVRGEFEDRTWVAFWRATVDGHPPALIADEMGVTPAAVRQAKSRVLRRLKDLLGEPPRPTPQAVERRKS
ncbi:RNA polymerase sigma factor [Paludisphaera soli]|uniref:RNA polymerase sigma factor n=1 Tax=Paludisphaera soli TaxID=2712865 RepID=UPI0013ED2C21|nr:sigma-70 family RNA polymerase sigma factor [Paludisphaera soli]